MGRLAALALVAIAIGACGSSAATEPSARTRTVVVSGTVARSCPGPLIAGRARRCFDRAVFKRYGKRWTVHDRFSIRLARGVYDVLIDTCDAPQRITVRGSVSGLKLVPHCVVPL